MGLCQIRFAETHLAALMRETGSNFTDSFTPLIFGDGKLRLSTPFVFVPRGIFLLVRETGRKGVKSEYNAKNYDKTFTYYRNSRN
jgi:hypothetical protein